MINLLDLWRKIVEIIILAYHSTLSRECMIWKGLLNKCVVTMNRTSIWYKVIQWTEVTLSLSISRGKMYKNLRTCLRMAMISIKW